MEQNSTILATWIELEGIMLSKISHTEKGIPMFFTPM